MENCRKNILHIVKEQGDSATNVDCSVFGVLGSYGVAVVWVSDQFVEILRLINLIKGKDICAESADSLPADSVLLSAFTIFAKNILPDETIKAKLPSVMGKAILQVTLQSNLNEKIINELQEKISGIKSFHSAGEHDLLLFTDARNLYDRFEKKEIFDPQNPFYKNHILQTNLELCETITKESVANIMSTFLEHEKTDGESWNDESLQKKVDDKYRALRRRFFECFPKTAGMVDSLDLLYGDYLSKIATVSNAMWAEDFVHHFLAILNVLDRNLEMVLKGTREVSTLDALTDFREILNCFEYQIVHIAESNNLVLDTPKCHLRYTGQNNLTLYTYFGIVKEIIELMYSRQRMCKQSQIIPLILVDTIPIINSVLFSDYGDSNEDRVLKISLPMMALYNIPAYSPYLFHELYHYAVPEDRAVRNWKKGCCLITIGIVNVIKWLIYSNAEELTMKNTLGIVNHVLLPIQKYQKQKSFGDLNEICKTSYHKNQPYIISASNLKNPENLFINRGKFSMSRRDKEKISWQYVADGIESLCGIISIISDAFGRQDMQVYKNRNLNHNLWYRGHQKQEYKLLPSAMRKYKTVSNTHKNLCDFQRKAYEEFRFRADASADQIDKAGYTDCDYLALMQHYGAPTIYMDWSESAIQALYFALEAYIDPKKSNEQNDENAILYVLHPNLYNKARDEIMKIVFEEDSDSELDHMMKSTTTQEVSSTVEKQGEQEKRTQDLSRALFGLPSLEFCRN